MVYIEEQQPRGPGSSGLLMGKMEEEACSQKGAREPPVNGLTWGFFHGQAYTIFKATSKAAG